MMKAKKVMGMIGSCMLCIFMFAGCGSKEANANGEESVADFGSAEEKAVSIETEESKTPIYTGYVFESGGVEITVDMDMSVIEDKLGEPAGYYEEPSCAAQGIAKIYTYSGFEIETYPDGEMDLIACIVLKDDSVATPEGVDLSMAKDDIIAAYGSDYEETETSMVYEKSGTKLCFIMDGDDIASIEYDSPILN